MHYIVYTGSKQLINCPAFHLYKIATVCNNSVHFYYGIIHVEIFKVYKLLWSLWEAS